MASKESYGISRESVDSVSFSSAEKPYECDTVLREEKEQSFLRRLKSLHCMRYIYFQMAKFQSREPMANEDTYKEFASKDHWTYCPVEPMDLDHFGWEQRMELAIRMGEFLKEFHDEGLVHGGIDSQWILIDENYFPKCFGFKVNSYCEDRPGFYEFLLNFRYGSCAPAFLPSKLELWAGLSGTNAICSLSRMTYGILRCGLLLELISKEIMNFDRWLEHFRSYKGKSFVHESFNQICDEHIGTEITSCALQCLGISAKCRPAIGDVLEDLKELVESILLPKHPKMSN